jgi:hypothetical protein
MTTESSLDGAGWAKRPWTSAPPTTPTQPGEVTVIVPTQPPVLSPTAARALLRLLAHARGKQQTHSQPEKEGDGQS